MLPRTLAAVPVTFAQLRKIALTLPAVEERLCHGTPAFYLRKKLFCRLQEDDEHVSIAFPKRERDDLIDRAPDVFSSNDHFTAYDYVLMNLIAADARVARERLEGAWRMNATKREIAAFDLVRR